MLACGVLGPTEVEAGGVPVALGGPLVRRLFTALVAAEGLPVPDDRLAEAVWGASGTARAAASLQVYVSRLRRALGDDGRDLLVRHGLGYLLRLEPDAVDAVRFAQEVDRGRRLLTEGAAAQALETLTGALGLWRGEPYAELPDFDGVSAARSRLTELRAVAVEERMAALLATGDARQAVTELDAVVKESPYRERGWALLVLGLYRTGRQGEALAALRRVRRLLADELGVDPGQELQDLEGRVLAQDPRLLLAATSGTRVGRPLSSFLGRDRELAATAAALAGQRLVTLVGPAGVGKTRLVVEYLAARAGTDDGWLVRLADVHRAEVLAAAVAGAVGIAADDEPRAALVRGLQARPGLLVLDNCEHLVAPVAALVLDLLGQCPGLRILATSREQLGVDGETVLPVEPLPVDPDGPAVELLLDRIRSVRPGWTPTPDDLAQARRLCVALDGLPLALELAAARARVLGIGEIVDRLDDRFAVLGPVPRGSLTAHATLRAAVGWSVDQLSEPDRAMLLRLWPFEGGFSLEAADAVRPDDTVTVESLSSLVARSVVVADTTVTPTRYRLLETLRAYCEEHDPDPAGSREAHAAWIRALVSKAERELRTRRSGHMTRVLNRELPNLRTAIEHDLRHRPDAALRAAGELDWFWVRGGHFGESLRLVVSALLAAPDAAPRHRARAYAAAGNLAGLTGDLPGARRHYQQAIALVGDATGYEERLTCGRTRYYSALVDLVHGDAEAAARAAELAIAIGHELEVNWVIAGGEMTLGAALVLRGDVTAGEATLAKAIEHSERSGVIWCAAWAEMTRGHSLLHRATGAEAGPLAAQAMRSLRRALELYEFEGDTTYTLAVLRAGIAALALLGRPADAVRLRAAVDRHYELLGRVRPPANTFHLGLVAAGPGPEQSLSPAELAEASRAGVELSWQAMVGLLASESVAAC